jgi:mRNA interferase MazF
MKNLEGSICLIPLPQADGKHKIRPVLLLKQFSPFNDYLVCGISTQIHQFVDGFDELLSPQGPEFIMTGLRETSLIRLGYLSMIEGKRIPGTIGRIPKVLLESLLLRLANYLISKT